MVFGTTAAWKNMLMMLSYVTEIHKVSTISIKTENFSEDFKDDFEKEI